MALLVALGFAGAGISAATGDAAAQETPSYMDELLAQAEELLANPGPNRDFAVVILEELVGAGSEKAEFVLARVLADPQEDAYDFARGAPILEQVVAQGGDDAVAALKLLAAGYRDATQPHYDPPRAASAYEAAAELGDTDAMIALAAMFATGEGVGEADPESAGIWLEKAVSIGDDNASAAAAALAALYQDVDDPEKAVDAFRHAAEFGDTSAMLRLAELLVDQDDLDGARDMLEQAIAAGTESPVVAWQMLADVNLKAGDAAAAVEALRNAASQESASAMVRLAAMLAAGEGVDQADPAAAASLLERAVSIEGGHVGWAWNTLARLRRDAGDTGGAAAAYRQSAELGDSAAMIMLAAMIAEGEGADFDLVEVETLLEDAIALQDGNLGWALYTQARILRANGELERALAAGQAGVEAGETGSMILVAQMLADGEGGSAPDVQAAAQLLLQAAALDDGNAGWAARTLAGLYSGQGDSPEAREAFALAAEHGDTVSMIRLAALLTAEGEGQDLDRATTLLQQAIDAGDSNATWAWYTLAEVHRAAGDLPAAVEAYAVAVDAGDPNAMIQLAAMVARGEGVNEPNPEGAIDLLERAIAVEGDHTAWGQWTLAELHRSLGETDSRHLAAALKLYGALSEAGDGRAHLAAAEIIAAERGAQNKWREMVGHYREAARALGAEPVTASMLRLDPKTMYASLQILLTDAGYNTGYVDGVRGRRTDEAISGFCQDNRPPSGCVSSIVTRGLLGALIEAGS